MIAFRRHVAAGLRFGLALIKNCHSGTAYVDELLSNMYLPVGAANNAT